MRSQHRKVISASRREDLPGFAAQRLIDSLEKKCPPHRVHTLVLWTKNPLPLISNAKLNRAIQNYDQLFIHLTVTGMGGTPLEPGIPETSRILHLIPNLIQLVGSPERMAVRFDPIVHFQLPDGTTYTNIKAFKTIAVHVKEYGIGRMITSWMTTYPKVNNRLRDLEITSVPLAKEHWKKEMTQLKQISKETGVELQGCCVPDMKMSACVDGCLFNQLHPEGLSASIKKAGGQREHCGCTESWDIGWYYPCPGGCVYCYANPKKMVAKEDFMTWNPDPK